MLLGFQPQRRYGGAHPGVAGTHGVFVDGHGVFVHWVGRGAGGAVAPVHRAGAVQGRRDGGDAGHDAGAVHGAHVEAHCRHAEIRTAFDFPPPPGRRLLSDLP